METGTGQGIWTYQDETIPTIDLTGYSVEATDGSIGKIDEATNDVGSSYIVVDTGPWIFGKQVLLPAGIVTRVDSDAQTVYVNQSKDAIKNAPEYDKERGLDETYRTEVGGYYSSRI